MHRYPPPPSFCSSDLRRSQSADLRRTLGPFDEFDDEPEELDLPVERPFSREEIDALLDKILDEELERLRDLEEEMRRPPN